MMKREAVFQQDDSQDIPASVFNALSGCVMLLDSNFVVTHMNHSLYHFFKQHENLLRIILPSFSADQVVGSQLDVFHKQPAQLTMKMAQLTQSWSEEIRLAKGLIVKLVITPLFKKGQREGFIIEWSDRSSAVEFESKLQVIVSSHELVLKAFNELEDVSHVWEGLLAELLKFSRSHYGFVAEIVQESDSEAHIKINAIAQKCQTKVVHFSVTERALCETQLSSLMKLIDHKDLFISHDVVADGIHLPLAKEDSITLMVVPIFVAGKLVGMYGVANDEEEYDDAMVAFLEPLNSICGVLINNARQVRQLTLMSDLERMKKLQEMQHDLINHSRHALMGEMIAMISHQWRQPLALSMLNVEILTSKIKMLPISESDKNFLLNRLSLIGDMVMEKSNLITDFTDFFKPDKERSVFNLASCINASLVMFEAHLSGHNIVLTKEIDRDCVLVGIEREFRQVIINIVKNAIDQLIEHRVKQPKIHLKVAQKEGMVVIDISDNGGGISADILPTIFDPYVSSKSLNGTGLGLYMVKMILVDNFGGDIRAYNSAEGAVFSIQIG